MIKVFTAALCLLGTVSAPSVIAQTKKEAAPALRPNVVMILVDDQRWDDFGFMGHPFVRTPHIDRIAREGIRFNNAFVTTPLSSPSRAGFMTGQYAHTVGVMDNVPRNELSHQLVTWPRVLKDAGYTTAFVGKWHMGNDDTARPGFDHWVSASGQGDSFKLDLNVDGKRKRVDDYVTDVFTDYAVDFLKRDYDRPLCLILSHKAIHPDLPQNPDGSLAASDGKFPIAKRHEALYSKNAIERRPNFGSAAGKPALLKPVAGLPPLSAKTATDDETVRNRLRMLAAVDESVQRVLEILEDTGKLNNTLFIFSSDQGYFYGEHGLSSERRLAYEESIHIPLLMRLPKVFKPGTAMDGLVLNLDIAPTVLELAGATSPVPLQGRSLVPVAQPGIKMPWRTSFLIEYFAKNDKVFPRTQNLSYQAVRTDGWKYIHYTDLDNADELYDLRADPYEQMNLFWEPGAQGPLMKMQLELVRQVKETN